MVGGGRGRREEGRRYAGSMDDDGALDGAVIGAIINKLNMT